MLKIIFIILNCIFLLACNADFNNSTSDDRLVNDKNIKSELSETLQPPLNCSISIHPKLRHEKFKWVLDQANIPYRVQNYKGKEWIIWPDEYTQIVNKLKTRSYKKNNLGKGHIALDSGNFKKGIDILSSEAENGNPKAQVDLAFEYRTGKHVNKDLEKAYNFYLKAANSGCPEAYANLGLMHEKDNLKDCEKAVHWFKKGAKADDPYSMWKLGQYYQQGKCGLPKDEKQASYWLDKVKKMGFNFS